MSDEQIARISLPELIEMIKRLIEEVEIRAMHFLTKPKVTPETRLLRGIGQIEIVFFGTKFLEQGYITTEEYDSLKNEIYAPYLEMGGNGLAKKMMEEIEKLPIK